MRLHVVLRSTGKENLKPRPPWYSKLRCLFSVIRAALVLGGNVELIYLNDGEIDDRRKEVMMRTGEVITGDMGLSRSYMRAVDIACRRRWPSDDLVYLCEEDHLHDARAFSCVQAAAAALPADYFGFYASVDAREPNGNPVPPSCIPRRWRARSEDAIIESFHWRPALSTTSTFVVRMDALRRDAWVHRVGCKTPGAFDHSICLAYQGYVPFSSKSLLHDLVADNGPVVRRIKVGLYDVALDILALRASLNHHILLGVTPALACHLEDGCLAVGVDWEKIAVDTDVWAAQSGFRSLLEIG